MLLETDGMPLLDFQINRGLSLRGLLKQDRFKALVRKAASLFESKDYQTTVCLLDKIKEFQAVLEKLVDISFERIAATKPLDFTQPGGKLVHVSAGRVPTPRVMQEFAKMLASYRKEGIPSKHGELFTALETLDKVAEAFDLLGSFQTAQDLQKALSLLEGSGLVPAKTGKDRTKIQQAIDTAMKFYAKVQPRMMELAFDCMMAISKLCFVLKKHHLFEKAKAGTTLQASKVQKEI